ncbi:hypothetical protein [Shimia thalassica]|uniref:hypothetical protein n=1 Tax=Shimia thalassica TaxID=1715693 RepID=UPI002733E2D7|nr:hypothetical protein [Shimia thalassica]MDP2517931.1 hypothetical protein [Shimia thalassica]
MIDHWNIQTISSGALDLHCLPGIGGRLWDIEFDGQSFLFQNKDLIGLPVDLDILADLPTRSPQFGFPLWGGEKTWISPDSDWPNSAPFPVLDSGPYCTTHTTPQRLGLQSQICPISHLQIERDIRLTGANRFSLRHRVTNLGATERYTGNWSVMMLNRPTCIGLGTAPHGDVNTVFGDPTGRVRRHGGFCLFDCNAPQEFKTGLWNTAGRVLMRMETPVGAYVLSCVTSKPDPDDSFAHGKDFEVFNSADYAYCEVEWHSPARTLMPNESLSYQQDFEIQREKDVLSAPNTTLTDLELLSCMS